MKRSENIVEFSKALSAFNAEVGALAKDAENPFFKSNYLSLDKIIEETRPILQKHGLSVMQFPSGDGSTVSVTTMLLHVSGEYIESDPLTMKPVKNDPQAIGSCVSYARRYSLQAILSLNTGAEDDDGNNASGKNKGSQNNQPPKTNNNNNNNNTPDGITEGQVKAVQVNLNNLTKAANTTKERLITRLETEVGKFGSVTGMTKGQATKSISLLKGWIETTNKQGG